MPKANPLGNLEYEVVHHSMQEGSSTNDDAIFSQAVTHTSLNGQQTFAKPVMESYPRPELELRKMHVNGGEDTSGTQDTHGGEAGPALSTVANTK